MSGLWLEGDPNDHFGRSPIDEADKGVGAVCRWWVAIEHIVHDICLHAAEVREPALNDEPAREILHMMLSNMDIRGKADTADALIYKLGDEPLSARAHKLLRDVSRNLKDDRNAAVHQMWDADGRLSLRLGAKVTGGDRTPLTLAFNEERRLPNATSLHDLVDRLMDAHAELVEIENRLAELFRS